MNEIKNVVLVVDDEAQIRKMLNIYLEISDYRVEEAENGRQAVRMSSSIKPDLVLLDLGLPDIDGKEVIAAIRAWSHMPIIVLTARSGDQEVVDALNMGADDYVVKPFNTEVLLARIQANLRKVAIKEAGDAELKNGNLRMDLVRHEVFLNEEKIALTPKEYDLLRYFIVNRGKMLTHKQILREVWGPAHVDDTQYLRVYIGQLREKISEHENSSLIVTEPGVGYRMEIVQPDMAVVAA